jgi:hypothetical protein
VTELAAGDVSDASGFEVDAGQKTRQPIGELAMKQNAADEVALGGQGF